MLLHCHLYPCIVPEASLGPLVAGSRRNTTRLLVAKLGMGTLNRLLMARS